MSAVKEFDWYVRVDGIKTIVKAETYEQALLKAQEMNPGAKITKNVEPYMHVREKD